MPEHRRDADRTSHVRRCSSQRSCSDRCEESVAEICVVQLGKTSRPRPEWRHPGCQTCPYSLLQTQTVKQKIVISWRCDHTPDRRGHNPGRNTWMEIAQKLVAVGVVSAVSSTNGFQWCFALTMTMAATSGMVQPYAQPQARPHVLQIMFHGPWTWANNFSVKVKAQVCQNTFWGEEFGGRLGQKSYKVL